MANFFVAVFSKEGQTVESLLYPFNKSIKNIGENGEAYYTINPHGKWDMYYIGGKWVGVLRLKRNLSLKVDSDAEYDLAVKVNSAKIKDIDFSIDDVAYQKALRFWELVVEGSCPTNYEEERTLKRNWHTAKYYIEKWGTKENYATIRAETHTHDIITPDGKWHSKEETESFGYNFNLREVTERWNEFFKEPSADVADPEWTLTIVTCHI